jgi:hypothetical protein
MAREIVPQTLPPRLPVWMVPKLYSQACAVYWNYLHTSFSSQMIRFTSSGTCGTWPYPPFSVCHPFLLFLVILFFVRQKMFHVTNIIIDAKKLNSKTCIHVKFSSCTIWKVPYQKTYGYIKKFLVGGSFAPHRLFNFCNALSECFYTRVLLGSSECFYWVPERCFVI